ncbi:MAG: glycosyltransferase family 9 protein [bacterium]
MKILILRVSAIGDVIHTFPAIFLIKKIIPDAKISWVVQKKAAHLLFEQSFLENVWVLPDKFLKRKNWAETTKIVKEIRKTNWDVILDFQGILKTSVILSFLKGLKIGFDKNNARAGITTFFTHKQITPKYTNIIQKNMALVSHALLKINSTYKSSPAINSLQNNFYLNYPKHKKDEVDKWLAENKINKLLLLAPSTTWPSKHWPTSNWQNLLNILDKSYFASSSVKTTENILCSFSEREKASKDSLKENKIQNTTAALLGQYFGEQALILSEYIKEKNLNVVFVPKWDLLTTAYLITKTNLLVAPDTGILHLGDYLGTETIAIFGPTLALRHGPFLKKENIKNAIQIDCPHHYQKTHGEKSQKAGDKDNCMYKLTPEKLSEKIYKIMQKPELDLKKERGHYEEATF